MAEGIITRRGAIGIKPYVVQTSLTETTGDTADDVFDHEYGVQAAYYDNGDVFISVKRSSDSSSTSTTTVNESSFSAPDGVSIIERTVQSSGTKGESAKHLYGWVVRGISSNVSVEINLARSSASVNPYSATITITEV